MREENTDEQPHAVGSGAEDDVVKPRIRDGWWWGDRSGERRGPCSSGEMHRAITEGRVTAHTFVWREGQEGWTEASEVAELAPHVPESLSSGAKRVLGQAGKVAGGIGESAYREGRRMSAEFASKAQSTGDQLSHVQKKRMLLGSVTLMLGLLVTCRFFTQASGIGDGSFPYKGLAPAVAEARDREIDGILESAGVESLRDLPEHLVFRARERLNGAVMEIVADAKLPEVWISGGSQDTIDDPKLDRPTVIVEDFTDLRDSISFVFPVEITVRTDLAGSDENGPIRCRAIAGTTIVEVTGVSLPGPIRSGQRVRGTVTFERDVERISVLEFYLATVGDQRR